MVQWRCTSCSSWADLADAACPTCGAPRRGFGDAHDSATTSRTIDRATARVAAVALPGLGHMLAGRHAAGIARAVLGLLWLLGGLTLTVGAAPGTARVPGLVLLLGAAVLWVAAALDVDALVRGGADAVLTGRRLLWLVVGVTGGLVLATVGAIAGGTSSVVG